MTTDRPRAAYAEQGPMLPPPLRRPRPTAAERAAARLTTAARVEWDFRPWWRRGVLGWLAGLWRGAEGAPDAGPWPTPLYAFDGGRTAEPGVAGTPTERPRLTLTAEDIARSHRGDEAGPMRRGADCSGSRGAALRSEAGGPMVWAAPPSDAGAVQFPYLALTTTILQQIPPGQVRERALRLAAEVHDAPRNRAKDAERLRSDAAVAEAERAAADLYGVPALYTVQADVVRGFIDGYTARARRDA